MALKLGDRSRSYTAENLIRKYNLDGLNKDRETIKTISNGLTKVNVIVEDYVRNTTKYINNQVDGFITAWFYNGVPTSENEPFISFKDEGKEHKVDDLYYDRESGFVYQLKKNEEVYFWCIINSFVCVYFSKTTCFC